MKIDLKEIHSPADIKRMTVEQLEFLCAELRANLIKKLAVHGGHVGPNLGVVEATVALHYVFDAPHDQLVFDVSHQSYVHKMITGRIGAFIDPARYDDVTGFTSPHESEYDLFEIGHTSTSISLATGLASARDMKGGSQNVVAFIGDASLGGGMALEGLNFAPTLGSNFILIVNDNQMSIAENKGELYNHLAVLRETNGESPDNIFKALGYEYHYVKEGNDLRHLIKAFKQVKDVNHAVVVHINTMKGMGLPVAEIDKEKFHFSAPFNPQSGVSVADCAADTYDDIFADFMLKKISENKDVVVLNAGTPGAIGFTKSRREAAGNRFIDVGIAEQDCVTMAAGMAKGGVRPVMGVVSTFFQRAYDQLSHDVAINNLPAVFVEFFSGIYGMNDITHLGIFDIAMVSNIPNIMMISATNVQEYTAMIEWAIKQTERPVVIRTPGGKVVNTDREVNNDFSKYEVVEHGKDIAIIAEGSMLSNALAASEILRSKGLQPTVINPRILSWVDKDCLDTLTDYKCVITVEDGILNGGFGQKVAAYLSPKNVKVTCLGLKNEFMDRFDRQAVLEANRMTPAEIAKIALESVK